jgi:type IV pilus assembly protein PilV
MIKSPQMRNKLRQRGVSLVEALVALVVMSVGMLGIASLYVTSLQTGRSALIRTQAVNIVNDMADRIRANSRGRAGYNTADFKAADTAPNCTGEGKMCSPTELAKSDLSAWMALFKAPAFPTGTIGTVKYDEGTGGKADRYQINLSWPEAGQTTEKKVSNDYNVSLRIIPVRP